MRASSRSFSLMTCASAPRRSAILARQLGIGGGQAAGLGMRSAAGTILTSRIAVGTEAGRDRLLPLRQPVRRMPDGPNFHECEAPQAMMNVAKTDEHPSEAKVAALRTK